MPTRPASGRRSGRYAGRRSSHSPAPASETLAARFTPHGLRHTFAALHLQAATDVYYVSRMLGHADISLTVHTYGAWLQPDRRSGLDVLDRTPAEADAQEARG
jgi:integrase